LWASQVEVLLDHNDDPRGSSKMLHLTRRNTSEIMQPFDQDVSLARHVTPISNYQTLLLCYISAAFQLCVCLIRMISVIDMVVMIHGL